MKQTSETMQWATTYTIETSGKPTREHEALLKGFVDNLRDNPQVLANVAAQMHEREVADYAAAIEKYQASEDLTISCVRDDKSGALRVRQRAKGIGKNREIHAELRRAFCRLVLSHCHSHGFDVDIKVV